MARSASPVRHLGRTMAYYATRRRRDARDHETLAHLSGADAGQGLGLPPGLGVEWLGTAGFALSYQGHTLLIDPYFSRISLREMLGRKVVAGSRGAAAAGWTGTADAVLVGHTHFDHAMDVPEVVRRTGAPAYGSSSLRALLGLYGLAASAVVTEPYRTYEVGPFEFSFVPSTHAKLNLGLSVPFDGEITCDHLDELIPRAYRCGQTWGMYIRVAGISVYHQGSAALVDDAVRHSDIDLFLCGIAGRQFSDRYVERVLRRLEPAVIVPCHYDDFLRPLQAPLGFAPDVDLTGFTEEVAAVSSDFTVRALPMTRPFAATDG